MRDELILGGVLHVNVAHVLAVAQHGDAVADIQHLFQAVGDEDDADARLL